MIADRIWDVLRALGLLLFSPLASLRQGRELSNLGTVGTLIGCLPVVGWLSWAFLPYAWRRQGRWIPTPVAAALIFLVAASLTSVVFVAWARGHLIEEVFASNEDISRQARLEALYISVEMESKFCLGATLVLAAPVLGAVLALRYVRAHSGQDSRSFVSLAWILSAATSLFVVALALFVIYVTESYAWHAGFKTRYALAMDAFWPISCGRYAVLALGIVATIVVLAAGSRPRGSNNDGASTAWWGAMLSVAGAASWMATRAVAYDAAHPLPFSSHSGPGVLSVPYVAAEATCRDPLGVQPRGVLFGFDARMLDVPIVEVVDGKLTTRAAFWRKGLVRGTLDELRDDFLSAQKHVASAIDGSGSSFYRGSLGRVFLAASSDTPAYILAGAIETARQVGYTRLDMIVELRPVSFETRTLGAVQLPGEHCFVEIPATAAVPHAGTWAEFLATIEPLAEH